MHQQIEEFVSFGEWVRRRRKMLDFTRVALAGLVACSADMIKKIERDERRPSLQLAELLAKQLQISEQVTEKFLQMARGKYVPTLGSPLKLPNPTLAEKIPSNFPQQLTSFIGREAELAKIAMLLTDPACRLLTLVGPGGMGKTRLALQAATEALDIFADGACYVPLTPLVSHEFLITAIAKALNLSFHGPAEPKTQVMNYLQHKECLLLLDNFEHILAGATLLSKIVMAAPGVKLLVTSRERLSLQEEWLFELQGMTFPVSPSISAQGEEVHDSGREQVEAYSAVQLFKQRARQAQSAFELATEYPAVVRICQLVDGMPLGLELAASWTNLMPCREIALEIEQNLDFLTTALRNVPERHRSLRAVFEHSWQFLSDEEKEVFRRLSVFRGGFTRSAAESITGATLHILMALVSKSLIQPEYTGRYHIHELLRQFGAEKLAEEMESTRNRHLTFFLRLAEEAEPHLLGSDQATWLNRLELEHDNLRAAVDWSRTAESTAELSLRLAGSLALFWNRRSYMSEGREYLSAALSRPEASPRTAARAKALHAAGLLAYMQSDYPATRPLLEESISIYRELHPTGRRGLADALITLGDMKTGVGDYVTASSLMKEALGIMRALKDGKGIARALWQLGSCAVRLGDYEQAVQYLEESLPLCKQVGDKNNLATVLSVIAEVAARQSDYGHATKLEEESLALRREIGTNWGIAVSLGNFAWIALRQGDLKQAVALLGESLTLRLEIEDAGGAAWCLEKMAEIAVIKGQRESSSRRKEGFQRAARLFGAAEALRGPVNSAIDLADRPEYERQVALVRAHLDGATFATAWAEGQAMGYVPSLLE